MIRHTLTIRKVGAAIAVTLGLLTGSVLLAPAAFANAYGYAYWGPVVVNGVTIPSGQLFGAVEGHGTRVDRAGGNFGAAGNLCRAYFEIAIIDPSGAEISRVHTSPGSCSHVGQAKVDMQGMVLEDGSKVSIRLFADNGRRKLAEVTHNIEPYGRW